jgi:hypothetical protein
MYNHKQRREMEKNIGLLKEYKNMSEAQKAEVRKKKRAAGEQIHLRNLQESENARLQAEAELEAENLRGMIERGYTQEHAEEVVRNNRELNEQRAMKLAERKRKQEERFATKNTK